MFSISIQIAIALPIRVVGTSRGAQRTVYTFNGSAYWEIQREHENCTARTKFELERFDAGTSESGNSAGIECCNTASVY